MSKFVSLSNESVRPTVEVKACPPSYLVGKKLNVGDVSFDFVASATEDNQIEVAETGDTSATGYFKASSDTNDGYYLAINSDKAGVQPLGVIFARNGAFCAFKLVANVSSGKLVVNLGEGESRVRKVYTLNEASGDEIHVNSGYSVVETAGFFKDAFNETLSNYGIFANVYYDTVVLYRYRSTGFTSVSTPKCVVRYESTAVGEDYLLLKESSSETKISYGSSGIATGSTPEDSANNAASYINSMPSGKFFASVDMDGSTAVLRIYGGFHDGFNVECRSQSFSIYSLDYGSDSSDVTIDHSELGSAVRTVKVTSCDFGEKVRSMASLSAAIACLDTNMSCSFNSATVTCNIFYAVAGYNMNMTAYGGNLTVSGISGAVESRVDSIRTAENIAYALNRVNGMTASADQGIVHATVLGKARMSSDATDDVLGISPYPDGDADYPMSWHEFSLYVDDITSRLSSNIGIDVILTEGSFKNKPIVEIAGKNKVTVTIGTEMKVITLSDIYPLVLSRCDNVTVNISGMYVTKSSSNDGGLVNVAECSGTAVNIINCENSWVDSVDSPLVNFYGMMGSTMNVEHSTFTADGSQPIKMFLTDGYVKSYFSYCVFDGFGSEVCSALSKGSGCTASFIKCVSHDVTVDGYSEDCRVSSGSIVVNRRRENFWDLNLSSTSMGINIGQGSFPNDILGNARSLSKSFGKTTIRVKNVVGDGIFYPHSYISINGVKRYFGTTKLPLTYSSVSEFTEAVMSSYMGTDVRMNVSYSSSTRNLDEIVIYGQGDIVSSNVGTSVMSWEFEPFRSGTDAGSRQKATLLDVTYHVDLSKAGKGDGSEENPISYQQIQDVIYSLAPSYGKIRFLLTGSNDEADKIYIDPNGAPYMEFFEVEFAGKQIGKEYVPTLRSDFDLASWGDLKLTFNGIMYEGYVTSDFSTYEASSMVSIVNSVTNGLVYAPYVCATESTLIGGVNATHQLAICGCVAEGAIKFIKRGSVTGVGIPLLLYNCIKPSETTVIPSTWDTRGTVILSSSCLKDSGSKTYEGYELRAEEGYENPAEEHIGFAYQLETFNTSETDIAGRHRYSEGAKVSLDCGAIEKNVVKPEPLVINVNLAAGTTGNGGKYSACSLEEAYGQIRALNVIDRAVVLELSGYGCEIPTLDTSDFTFTDDGSIEFYGEPSTAMDGFLGDFGFLLKSDNATVVFNGILFRSSGRMVRTEGSNSRVVFTSCGFVNTSSQDYLVEGSWNTLMLGCSAQGGMIGRSTTSLDVVACALTGTVGSSFDTCTPYVVLEDAAMTVVKTEDVLSYKFFRISGGTAGFVMSDIGKFLDDYYAYEGDVDVRGYHRFSDNDHSEQGCYDGKAASDLQGYTDTPNGQYAKITEEGSSLITRAMTGTTSFKIVGYALGAGGYSLSNPVQSIPTGEDSAGVRATGSFTLTTNSLSDDDYVAVGNTKLFAHKDFSVDKTVAMTAENIVKALNEKCGSVYSYKDNGSSGTIHVVAVTAGEIGNSYTIGTSGNLSSEPLAGGEDGSYGVAMKYPSDGYCPFEFVERLPMAIALFLRVGRYDVSSGLGEVIVYAEITESEQPSEIGKTVPFAVVRHGLITKDHDTVITRRIIIQV